MSANGDSWLVKSLRAALRAEEIECADYELLSRYVASRDHAAFELLVFRHGPAVMGTAKRMLTNHHDAEDVVQAVFLLLARKASRIRRRESVGGWLYRVTCRAALRLRKSSQQRRQRLQIAMSREPFEDQPHSPSSSADAPSQVAVEELAKLPSRYREPLVLCCLEGMTVARAALELGCPQGTVCSRLERGKVKLRDRLARRGMAGFVPASLATAVEAEAFMAAPHVYQLTAEAILAAKGASIGNGWCSTAAVKLASDLAWEAGMSRVRWAAALVIGLAALGLAGAFAFRMENVPQTPPSLVAGQHEAFADRSTSKPAEPLAADPNPAEKPSAVLDGDWQLVRMEFDGESLLHRSEARIVYEFQGNTLRIHEVVAKTDANIEFMETLSGTIVCDRGRSPYWIEMRMEGEQSVPGIMEWDETRLRLCYSFHGKRPNRWGGVRGDNFVLVELRRPR